MKLNNEERKFKKLSELVSFSKTTLIPVDNQVYNYISLEHIESQTGRLINFSPTIWKQIKSGKVVFKKWMILYGKLRPYLNKVYIAEFDGIASTEILPMIVDDCIVTDYLALFLRSNKFVDQANNSISWARMPRVTTKFFQEYDKIPLPPLEEQKKIVAYLDELNATISKLKSEYQSQLAMLDEMRNSSLDLVFWGSRERERAYNLNNWKWVKLGEVCEIIWWGTPKTDVLEYRNNGTIRRATPTDLGKVWEIISISTTEKYITELGLKSSSAKILPKGAVLFSSRASIGKIAISETELSTNQWFANFVCGENIQNTFLAYVLLYFTEDIVVLSNSTTFKEVSKWSLKEFEIPLPDLETQSQIVSHLDLVHQEITALKAQVNSQIDRCDELWQSSLEKVLTQGVNKEFN